MTGPAVSYPLRSARAVQGNASDADLADQAKMRVRSMLLG